MKSISFKEGIERIIKEFELPTHFDRRALREAEALSPIAGGEDRVDLTGEITVTIDGETARDFDDAVSIGPGHGGGFVLKVSIADVGAYVKTGSHIDQEAYSRGTSTYFPNRCLPMLPERLSNNLCSLVPNEVRPTMTAEMEFDNEGHPRRKKFYRSLIRSSARLTYTIVRRILADRDPEACREYKPLLPSLEMMGHLAEKLRVQRKARGSLDFDLPEPEIVLDLEQVEVEEILRAERNLAHRMIEEFMIAANEAVAEFITAKGQPMIYRIHEEPAADRVADFTTFLHNLGVPLVRGAGRPLVGRPLVGRPQAGRPQAGPGRFVKLLDAIRGRPYERVVNALLLRTMSRAVYSAQNAGHFGLASKCYTHFTSPIRRYPDLVVHRILANLLEVSPRQGISRSHLERIAQHASERERFSMKAEWASRDLAGTLFMKDRIGEVFEGIIGGISKGGLFVELSPYLVQGLLPFRAMKGDFFRLREGGHEVIGRRTRKRYRLGDTVRVAVESVLPEKRWINLCMANFGPGH